MKLRLLLSSATAVVGLFAAGLAAAQAPISPNPFTVNASKTDPTEIPPPLFPTVGGATGTYQVTVNFLGLTGGLPTYSLEVTGNDNGVAAFTTGPNGEPPKSGIGRISFNLFQGFTPINIDSGGLLGSTDPWNPLAPSNIGGPANQPFGANGGTYGTDESGTSLIYSTADTTAFVAPRGGNVFLGQFVASAPVHPGDILTVSLQDSGQQWNGQTVFTPEPGSLALLLPGLAPLGLALRRRRSRRS